MVELQRVLGQVRGQVRKYEVGVCLLEYFPLTQDRNYKESQLEGAYEGNLRPATKRKRHAVPEANMSRRSSRRSPDRPGTGVKS